MLWRLHSSRATRPIRVERKADGDAIARAPEDWLVWWKATGERELRCILMTAWDPIGVGDAPEAWDEYDDYTLGVARRLREASTSDDAVQSVSAYLNHVERDFMDGLSEDRTRGNGHLAGTIVAWHEWSYAHDGRPSRNW